MGFFGLLSLIIGIIRLIPTAISLIMEIIRLFQSLGPGAYADKAALAGEFKAALQDARKTKDVSKLQAFHAKLGAICAGGLCGPLSAVRDAENKLG